MSNLFICFPWFYSFGIRELGYFFPALQPLFSLTYHFLTTTLKKRVSPLSPNIKNETVGHLEQRFSKDIRSLDNIFTFIDGIIDGKVQEQSVLFSIHLIVEELFTNMVKYSPEAKHDVLIVANWRNDDLIISLTDFDVKPFDITKAGDVRVNEGLADRKVGGLGLHLVRKMVDEINYQYKNNNSTITIVKRLES